MAYELYLRHYDRLGVLKRAVINPISARYTESDDGQDPLVFSLNYDDESVDNIEEFDIMQVMIRNLDLGIFDADGGFVSAFIGLVRDWDLETDEDGLSFYKFAAPNEKHILSWRSVMWHTGFANRSKFTDIPAETIMKTLVRYNFTSDATVANGRDREGDLLPGMGIDLTFAADQARGDPLDLSCMGGNVFTILQKLAPQGGGDFSLRWQGGNQWEFEFHPGQLGEDKSIGTDRVLFSLKNGTMSKPRLKRSSAKATIAISAGQGQGAARQRTPVYGVDYAADCDIETFVDARNESTENGRIYRGMERLDDTKVLEELSFDVLQTANQFYSPITVTGRKTYRAGDLVLVVYGGVEQVRKINSIAVDWKNPSREDAFQVALTTSELFYAGS